MSSKIKELIEKATPKETIKGAYGLHEFKGKVDLELFARLLINECAGIVCDAPNGMTPWQIAEMIEDYFEIKE